MNVPLKTLRNTWEDLKDVVAGIEEIITNAYNHVSKKGTKISIDGLCMKRLPYFPGCMRVINDNPQQSPLYPY